MRVAVAALAALALVAAACGGSSSADGAPTATAPIATATPTASPVPGTPAQSPSPGATLAASPTPTATVTGAASPAATGTPGSTVTSPPAPPPAAATPPPAAAGAAVQSLYLESARVGHGSPVEVRDTHRVNGRETFEDPSAPQYIAWYARFGQPGERRANSIFAAHIDYVGYGAGPFRYLTSARVGDALHITLADGRRLTYTVKGVETIRLADLDMDAIVYPALASNTERVTLISCGGAFVPHASGVGGDYDSRVILVAERHIP